MRQPLFFAALSLLFLLTSGRAQAATLEVKPVRVHLSSGQRSENVELYNRSAERVRYQVTPHSWQQTPDGEMKLKPTRELVVYPSLVELAPRSRQRIKVATMVKPGAVETAYRIVMEPLPMGPPTQAGHVRMLTRVNMPVFLQPAKPQARPLLKLALRGKQLVVTVDNAGSSYLVARSVQLVGLSSAGKTVLHELLEGWYVLAGGRRLYSLSLPQASCDTLASLRGVLRTEDGVERAQLALPSGCGR